MVNRGSPRLKERARKGPNSGFPQHKAGPRGKFNPRGGPPGAGKSFRGQEPKGKNPRGTEVPGFNFPLLGEFQRGAANLCFPKGFHQFGRWWAQGEGVWFPPGPLGLNGAPGV